MQHVFACCHRCGHQVGSAIWFFLGFWAIAVAHACGLGHSVCLGNERIAFGGAECRYSATLLSARRDRRCIPGHDRGDLMRVLETERLELRPMDERDRDLYCRIYTDAGLMRHVGEGLTQEAALAAHGKVCVLNRDADFRYRCWVMRHRENEEDIGLLALVGHKKSAEIGAMILTEWHSRGIAAEVIRCLVEFAFAEYGIAEVYTRHHRENGLALGLMHKLNFVHVPSKPQDEGRIRWSQKFSQWEISKVKAGGLQPAFGTNEPNTGFITMGTVG